jgi:hypothetical protein
MEHTKHGINNAKRGKEKWPGPPWARTKEKQHRTATCVTGQGERSTCDWPETAPGGHSLEESTGSDGGHKHETWHHTDEDRRQLRFMTEQTQLRILQYNVRKSKDTVMATLLRDKKAAEYDIIDVQEPWVNPFMATTHHPAKDSTVKLSSKILRDV